MEAKYSVKRIGPVVYQLTGDDKIEKGYLTNCLTIPRDDQPIATVRLDGTVIAMLDGYAIVPREEYEATALREAEAAPSGLEELLAAYRQSDEGVREWFWLDEIENRLGRDVYKRILYGPLPAPPAISRQEPPICTCWAGSDDANEPPGGWQGANKPPCPVHDVEQEPKT